MEEALPNPSATDPLRLPLARRIALASLAAAGHFDELRGALVSAQAVDGSVTPTPCDPDPLSESWTRFFELFPGTGAHDLDQRALSLNRQIRDNGVTYNVYADENGPQRPWSLDLFPLILDPETWGQIEAGVLQRMRLLEQVMADVYGPQQLLRRGLLPPALVQGHPGYLRAMHGVTPVGGNHLHIAAFDLARGPDGLWWVVGQRCEAPSGLGYLLENRLAVSAQFPQAFQTLRVQRLAATYRALVEGLKQMSPAGAESHLALLTPGPYNETYFEHAYLARYLGLTLVQGGDLIVRDERLYLKTLKGLMPVHGLLKRVDDQFLDPLELRADSTLGVPGLLQAIRAGNVLVANAPGSGFLESPALLGFLPALSRHLLGEELRLPALSTWWCGEHSAMDEALQQLRDCAIKATYPGYALHASFDAVLGRNLSERELAEWAGRIALQSEEHTVQAYAPLAQMPTWQSSNEDPSGETIPGKVSLRSFVLRVYAMSDGVHSWRVLPGGLARVAGPTAEIASMQRGGSSADVWLRTRGEVDQTSLLRQTVTPAQLAHRQRLVTSRAAENLFWLGRYTERAENVIRLARITLECLSGEDQWSEPLLKWLGAMAVANTLVLPGVPDPLHARRVFERSLIASLGGRDGATSVGYNLRALKLASSAVRERLSQEHWQAIVRAEGDFAEGCAQQVRLGQLDALQALRLLKNTSECMAAITGSQTDRMTRDDGWRLLSIGRHVERLAFLASSLSRGFEHQSVHSEEGFEAMISLFDSTITFHAQYQQSHEIAAMVDLLVLDRDNPRSLAWVAQTLRSRLARLAEAAPGELGELSLRVPNPATWTLDQLFSSVQSQSQTGASGGAQSQGFNAMAQVLEECVASAFVVSDDISSTYFTHSNETKQTVGS